MFAKYLLVGFLSIAVVLMSVPLLMRLALKLGFVDCPGGRKTHTMPTPLCGGIAIFLAVHLAMSLVYVLGWERYSGHLAQSDWLHLVTASGLVLVLGLVDDRFDITPRWKLAGQIVIALLVYASGTDFGKMLYMGLNPVLSCILTVLWLVGAMNAFNLIDGMDGLASGLGFIGATGLALLAVFTHNLSDALLMVALAGSCFAFLWYNFYPARAFLGDSGSMLIGFTLAWFALETNTKAPAMVSLLVPLLAMGIPLLDTFLALWRRFARHLLNGGAQNGSGIFTADREHLHDRLRKSGMSQRRAALALYILAIAMVATGIVATLSSSNRSGILMAAFAVFSYVVIRHLATVELWESGRLAVKGLHAPPVKVVAVIIYPLLDILILALALAVAIYIMGPVFGDDSLKHVWMKLAPVGVGVPFMGIVCSRAYRRVWSRASVVEYGILIFLLTGGMAVCAAVFELVHEMSSAVVIPLQFVYLGAALPWIVLVRMFLRILRNLMPLIGARQVMRGAPSLLIYGAGFPATLFIRQCGYAGRADFDCHNIIGFIDEDPNLRGRIVHGFRVLGNLADLDQVLREHNVKVVVVTNTPEDDEMAVLQEITALQKVELLRWSTELQAIAGRE